MLEEGTVVAEDQARVPDGQDEKTEEPLEPELQEAYEVFSMFVKNSSESVSAKELGNLLRTLGRRPTEQELQAFIKEVDPQKTNLITFDQLRMILAKKMVSEDTNQIKQAFQVFDQDGHGLIAAAELRYMLTNYGEKMTMEEVNSIIKQADVDSSGFVNYEELMMMMKMA